MNNKNQLLFINPSQFGYQAGYYYYAKYLRKDFKVNIICHDRELPILSLENVQVKYISFNGNKIIRYFRWISSVFREIKNTNSDTIIFMVYFRFCFVFGLFFLDKKIVLDIRTGSIKSNPLRNWFQNKNYFLESLFFRYITILSKGLIKHIGLQPSKCHLLPLGADIISSKEKEYNMIRLLYVGTFRGRRIHDSVKGVKIYLDKYEIFSKLESYDIFGFGTKEEEKKLLDEIDNFNLGSIVKYHGRKNHSELQEYFDKCNVGISYVPITNYYNYQPPTKTYEYILSGLVCIATMTYENSMLINDSNGVLCDDNPESFAQALKTVCYKRKTYINEKVRNTLFKSTWQNIVNNNLKIYLKEIINDSFFIN